MSSRIPPRAAVALVAALLAGPGAIPAAAAVRPMDSPTAASAGQDAGADDDLRSRVERLQAELSRLREQIEQLRRDAPADSASGVVAERLALLEQAQARLEEEIARLADDVQAAVETAQTLSESESRSTNLSVYGTFSARGYRGDTPVFDAESFELVVSGRPHPRLGFFAEIEFEQAAAVGGERGGEIVLEQAYANFSFSEFANLRAGVLLVPFGNVNVDHYAPRREVISKPLVSYVVVPSDWTDNGVGLYGRRLFGDTWMVDYEAYAISGLGAGVSATGLRGARQGFGVDNNHDKAVVGRVGVKRLGRAELGVSGYTGDWDDDGRQRLNAWAVDGRIELGDATLTGEFDRFVADGGPLADVRLTGFYVRLAVPVLRGFLKRRVFPDFDAARLVLVGQADRVTATGGAGPEDNEETRFTAGVNFRPSPQWVLKLDYEWNRSEGRPLYLGDRDGWLASIGFVF